MGHHHRDSARIALGDIEHGLLTQDCLLDRLQARPRLEADLLDEIASRLPVDLQSLGLAPRAVEGDHQLAAQPLAERMLDDESLELGDKCLVLGEGQFRFDPFLERSEPQLFKPLDLDLCEGLEREVAERRASPERERLAELLAGGFWRVSRKRTPSLLE